MYASKLLHLVEKNNTTTKRETVSMIYALHKLKHYLLCY